MRLSGHTRGRHSRRQRARAIRSQQRIEKEKVMHARFSIRIEQALAKLRARIARWRKRLNRDAINRRIGRLLQRNQRAAARFALERKDADNPGGCTLEVSMSARADGILYICTAIVPAISNRTEMGDGMRQVKGALEEVLERYPTYFKQVFERVAGQR